MAEPHQPTEGTASLQHRLVLDQKRSLVFDSSRILFVDAELQDSVYGTGTGLHVFRTADPNFLDSVKQAMSEANPVLEFRLGYGSPNGMFWLPWQRHIILKYYAQYEGIASTAGHLLIFKTANELVRLERSNKVLPRKGTIAEIVQTIAEENGLESVVESTDGKFLLYQCFEDDTRFIATRMLARAITKTGRGGFYFFIRDNVLHFHTPDYQSSARQLDYYKAFGTELTLTDHSEEPELWDSGLAGIRLISYDPYTGQTQEIQSQPANALRLADSIYRFSSVTGGEWNVPYHLSYNPSAEANAIAQFKYQRARQQTFSCKATLGKTIAIRHGDLLNISITQQTSKASSHSGYYYVTGAAHVVKKSAVTSMYTLERGEVRGQDQSLTVQNAQEQLVPESKAPGQDPNILEIQSSEQTKGAGKQSSARTFTVVADANKPLA
jgi:hypothetical protein